MGPVRRAAAVRQRIAAESLLSLFQQAVFQLTIYSNVSAGAVLDQRIIRSHQPATTIDANTDIPVLPSCWAGNLRVPLPPPAYGKYVNVVPHGVLPWKPRPLQASPSATAGTPAAWFSRQCPACTAYLQQHVWLVQLHVPCIN